MTIGAATCGSLDDEERIVDDKLPGSPDVAELDCIAGIAASVLSDTVKVPSLSVIATTLSVTAQRLTAAITCRRSDEIPALNFTPSSVVARRPKDDLRWASVVGQ